MSKNILSWSINAAQLGCPQSAIGAAISALNTSIEPVESETGYVRRLAEHDTKAYQKPSSLLNLRRGTYGDSLSAIPRPIRNPRAVDVVAGLTHFPNREGMRKKTLPLS